MQVIRTIDDIKQISSLNRSQDRTVGFVPTMGFLHEGHLALIKEASKETEVVILSIFVNPLQFGENEDFDQYPRNEAKDLSLAKEHGVDYVFIPAVQEIYHKPMGITMTVDQRVGVLCDRTRPGHFQGVLTVLTKLFHLIQPDYAYFGMKDAQQVAIVDLLIADFNFPIELRMIPTIREADGLAKSSRNVYLSDVERREAAFLYKALKRGKAQLLDGKYSTDKIVAEVKNYLEENVSGQTDYVEILSFPDLTPIKATKGQAIIALAVQFEQARLIDNIVFDLEERRG